LRDAVKLAARVMFGVRVRQQAVLLVRVFAVMLAVMEKRRAWLVRFAVRSQSLTITRTRRASGLSSSRSDVGA